jgi:uncharacterized DUF497 family protein
MGAISVFNDPDRIEFSSVKKEEKRFQTIGTAHGIVISLVYVVRRNNKRIISARTASKKEREACYEKND